MLANLLLFAFSFLLLWYGAGFIVTSTSKLTKKMRIAPFIFSFIFLGILTSIPEFSVGLQAVATHRPEIFVGNLLGGVIVLFLFVIPLLAIFGNGISLKKELDQKTLLITLFVVLAPSLAILDKRVTNLEGVLMIAAYLFLIFLVQRKVGLFDKENQLMDIKTYSFKDLLKILLGISAVLVSSSIIVDKTIYFAEILNISAFYIGLLIIAIGTDLPEISLAIRSVISGKKEIAMGDYVGAASASTLLFGVFTLLNDGEILTINNFLVTFIFISTALTAFFILSGAKSHISRNDGFILFGIYILFIIFELAR